MFLNIFIRFHRFWILNNIKSIFYFDVFNHGIFLKNLGMLHLFFPWTFWLGTQICNMTYEIFNDFFS